MDQEQVQVKTNTPADDIKDIIAAHVELTPDEQALADKIKPSLKAQLKPEVRLELEAEYAKRQKTFEETLEAKTKDAIREYMEQWKKEQAPLTEKEIGELLNQQYTEFTLKARVRDKENKSFREKEFTLCEMPQRQERRMLKILQNDLVPLLKKLVSAEFKVDLDSDAAEKLESIVQAAPEVLNILNQLVVICLDPYNEDKEITAEWVDETFSSYRQLMIVIAQAEVNRYRDFLSGSFRLSRNLQKAI